MMYRLKSNYVLRGWDKMSWVLVKRPYNQIQKLSKEMFQALLLCDGETELSNVLITNAVRQALEECREKEFIEECKDACPLDADQYYQYYNNRYVQMMFWSVTGKCNYRCRHCYMDAPDGALGELSTEDALHLIDQMAECGVLRVDITGGEPLVRKDFWQLVDRILSYKMIIGMIYTNGWLINNETLDEFERRRVYPEFSISFDGVGWHDWMRGIPGAEDAAIRALELCHKRGFSTNVEMCLHRGNQSLLPQTIELLRSTGVRVIKVSNVALTSLWLHNSEGNALTDQEYLEAVIRYIPKYYQAGRPVELQIGNVIYLHQNKPYEVIAQRYDGTEKSLDHHLCGAARWACYITPDGRLLPCLPMTASPLQNQFPKVQDIGLKEGLTDGLYMQFIDGRVKDLLKVNAECAACAHRLQCGGGCRAAAMLDGDHSLMGCDRSMCMTWNKGYVERIHQVADESIEKYKVHFDQPVEAE